MQFRTEKSTIFLSMHIKSVRFLSFALLAVESFRKTLRLQRAVILDGMNFQGLPKKRIIKNRLRCALKRMPLTNGKQYLTEKDRDFIYKGDKG